MIKNIEHYKLEHFFNSDFAKDLVKISIFKNPDGSYDLFDTYIIKSLDKKYQIETKHVFGTIEFYSLQNAVTWCIFTQKNKFTEANRIYILDKLVESINFSITSLRTKLNNSKDLDNIVIYSGKLSQDEAKKQRLIHELSGYRSQANYWKVNDFTI